MKNRLIKLSLGLFVYLLCFNAHALLFQGTSSGGFTNAQSPNLIVNSGNDGSSFLSTGSGGSTIQYTGDSVPGIPLPFDIDPNTPLLLAS